MRRTGQRTYAVFLYSRCARIAKELGYKKIITYILESEDGTSLIASGWDLESENCGGGSWDSKSRPRSMEKNGRQKYPTEKRSVIQKYCEEIK